MYKPGQKCPESGIWKPSCKSFWCVKIALSKDETFPPCSQKHSGVTWTLHQAT
ncbi:hypothetical protein LCGC14_0460130 [marine sediment metagenome]|uniref:Uncharacterized protein n=1 Tax=marine sediment metagenome TaxID=412755 RepID=A0A0F9VP31_9ZZZZ